MKSAPVSYTHLNEQRPKRRSEDAGNDNQYEKLGQRLPYPVSYTHLKKYGKAVYLLAKSALATKSVDKVVAWNEKQLRKTSFYKENRSVLNQNYIRTPQPIAGSLLLNELKKLKDGDFLIYSRCV